MTKLSLTEYGVDIEQLKVTDVNDLNIPNIQQVIDFYKRIRRNDESIIILGDVDPDGLFACYTAYNLISEFIPINRLHYFVNETKVHGIKQSFIDYVKQNNIQNILVVDAGTNDIEEISCLNNIGVNVMVIDHHVITTEYTHDNFILVNSTTLTEGKNVSGTYLVNDILKKVVKSINGVTVNKYDELGVVSLISDMCDKSDPFNRNVILNFILGSYKQNEVINLFRNKYTHDSVSFIISLTSTLNAIIRYYGPRTLLDMLLTDLLKLKEIINNKKELKNNNKEVVNLLIQNSTIHSINEHMMIVKLPNTIKEHKVKIRNYLGLIATRLANEYSKVCVVIANKSVNYEDNKEDYLYCFSARDYLDRDVLSIAIEEGIQSDGHPPAFGGYLTKTDVKYLHNISNRLTDISVKDKIKYIESTNIKETLDTLESQLPLLAIHNSVCEDNDKFRIKFKLTGQIVRQNGIKKVLYKNLVFKSFDKELYLSDNVYLTPEFNGKVEYFITKVK